MSLSRGYNLTPSALARIQLMDWIYDHGGSNAGMNVHVGQLFTGIDQEAGQALAGRLTALENAGIIEYVSVMDWENDSCEMTPAGVETVEEVRAARQDLRLRYIAVQDALLAWLYSRAREGSKSPQISDFLRSSYGSFYADPIAEREVDQATVRLLSDGYISGGASFGGGVGRPVITAKGEHLVEQGRSVGDSRDAPAGSVYNTTVTHSPGATVAQGSPGAAQTTTVTITQQQAARITAVADSLEALAGVGALQLDEAGLQEATRVVESLREDAASPTASPSALRKHLEKARDAAVAGGATAVASGVVALVEQAMSALIS